MAYHDRHAIEQLDWLAQQYPDWLETQRTGWLELQYSDWLEVRYCEGIQTHHSSTPATHVPYGRPSPHVTRLNTGARTQGANALPAPQSMTARCQGEGPAVQLGGGVVRKKGTRVTRALRLVRCSDALLSPRMRAEGTPSHTGKPDAFPAPLDFGGDR